MNEFTGILTKKQADFFSDSLKRLTFSEEIWYYIEIRLYLVSVRGRPQFIVLTWRFVGR
jgi:hypothetical protein